MKFRTREKSNIYKWKEKVQKNSQLSFWWKVKKFKLRNLPSRNSFLLSVLLRPRWAQRLSSRHLAAVTKPNIAELEPSSFFFPQPWFLRWSKHTFPKGIVKAYRNTCKNLLGLQVIQPCVRGNAPNTWRVIVFHDNAHFVVNQFIHQASISVQGLLAGKWWQGCPKKAQSAGIEKQQKPFSMQLTQNLSETFG